MQREEQQKHVASMMTGSSSSAARMAPASTAPQTIGDATAATAAVPPHMGDKINANVIQQITGGRVPPRPLWRNGEKTFPYKVYDMLEFAETSGNTDICSWLPSGDSFVIHDRKLFTEFILPRFFLHKKWRSFTRQLNIWCFKRDFSVTVADAYCHQYFKRGDMAGLSRVERSESKNLFKKDPVTNKRKPATQTIIGVDNNSSSSVTTKEEGSSSNSSTSGGPAKKRRQSREEEDVNEVANFLAGLKSTGSPEGSPSTPHKTVADMPSASTVPVTHSVVGKSKEGGIPVDTSGASNKKNMDEVNMTRALIASRLNMLPQQGQIALPYPSAAEQNNRNQALQRSNSGHSAASATLHRPPATASIGPNASLSFFGPSRPNGTFDRESLNHLSTDQLVALASHMKVREQMLRERAAASIADSAREQMLRERAAASIADSASAMGLMRPNHLHQQQLPLGMQCMPTREGGPFQRFPSSGSASSSTGVVPQMAMNPGWRDGGLTYHEMLQLQESRLGRAGAGVVPFTRVGMVQQGVNQRMAFLSGVNRNKPRPSYGGVPSPPQTTGIPNIDGISQNLGYPRAA